MRIGDHLLPEQQTKPVNKYLPPRPRRQVEQAPDSLLAIADAATPKGFWQWMDKTLDKLG